MHRVSIFQYVLFERSAVNLEVHTLNTHCSQWIWVVKKNLQFRNTNHNFNPFYGETKAYISPFLLPCSLRPLVSSLPCSKYNGVGKVKEKVKEKSFVILTQFVQESWQSFFLSFVLSFTGRLSLFHSA